ncbi:MAG: class II aldolase/adducin family protein [Acidobacteriota bacterium]|jgi:L-fuculose-phosphate aldolase|nr:MAG: class II aldolase family protein [Acidobacteriota bacterium]
MSDAQLRADIVEIGRRLWLRGFVASNDGNISVRIGDDRLLMTPTGVSKGFMTPDMMVITDMDGTLVSGAPGRRPSSEMKMHLVAYRERPDVKAVVHAHPPLATGFAVAGIPLDRAVLAEVVTTLGSVPIAEYATPSTEELPEAVRPFVRAHDGMLLANHGALTLGSDLYSAYYKMETIEHFARISLVARQLGRENLLSREEVDRLQGLRDRYGIRSPAPICFDEREVEGSSRTAVDCQAVVAPETPGGRLVPDTSVGRGAGSDVSVGTDGTIQLTYAQLTTLIDEAVRLVTESLGLNR